ncbi:(2Fe-2S)-binding protein [Nakamurella sp. YIM 132087]|uniref:(2Fe-2S)-binding protein n=1 Tax=Nakamurella alba TaxID=2665158 RepID=A0A7K1FRU3_9ACTN|nr:(2Fe-2S)-binding protein [Nakamurella alba]MTD15534.1 (2Fe-2S)-binding protein [Nakamurella alba]
MSFTFAGRPVPFEPEQSVGAALIATGVLSWRRTRFGNRPRGLYCGIGVCQDCLITIDGRPNQRACLVPAADGMQVATQIGNGHAG